MFRNRLVPRMTQVRHQFEDILSQQDRIDLAVVIRAFITAFMKMSNSDDYQEQFDSLIHREIHTRRALWISSSMMPFFHFIMSQWRFSNPSCRKIHLKLT
jgi:hypothetical protein